MESKTIQQARGRISFLRTVKGKDELESALLAKGYISDEVIERNRELYDQCMEEADGETPLTQLELMTFGTWYYLHPEKVAGKVVPQTSFQMPIKVVGTTKDFNEVFGLKEESEENLIPKLIKLLNKQISKYKKLTMPEGGPLYDYEDLYEYEDECDAFDPNLVFKSKEEYETYKRDHK